MDKENQAITYEKENLKRGLKSRHLEMIAIGGAIGTGLFYGSSWAIRTAGPAILCTYIFASIAIYLIMRFLGEMAIEEPVSGSFISYANRYVHRFAGFLTGWNAFVFLLATSSAELNALGHYIQFWFPDVPVWITAASAIILLFIVNIISVRIYGEAEFWFSMIKVLAIVAFIVFGFIMILWGIGGYEPIGFRNLYEHGGFMPHGWSGLFLCLVMVAFSFGGIENLGQAAGEVEDVQKNMRKAVNATFWRLLIFYVGAIFVLVTIFPWDQLTGHGSPFVEVFSMIGIPAAASIMNVVVITAVLSTVNSQIFTNSRAFYNLSLQHNAPHILSKVNKGNVPAYAIALVFILMLCGVLLNYMIPERVFVIFSSVTVFGELCNWTAITLSHLRFRKRRMELGTAETIHFKSPLYPYADYFVLFFMALIVLCIAVLPDMRISLVISALWVCVVFLAYKFYTRRQSESETRTVVVSSDKKL